MLTLLPTSAIGLATIPRPTMSTVCRGMGMVCPETTAVSDIRNKDSIFVISRVFASSTVARGPGNTRAGPRRYEGGPLLIKAPSAVTTLPFTRKAVLLVEPRSLYGQPALLLDTVAATPSHRPSAGEEQIRVTTTPSPQGHA
jgi:hypothetical protein